MSLYIYARSNLGDTARGRCHKALLRSPKLTKWVDAHGRKEATHKAPGPGFASYIIYTKICRGLVTARRRRCC